MVVRPSDLDQVRRGEANLVVDVSSSLHRPVRVTVTAGSAVALDVEVPAAERNRSNNPVHSYNYRLPAGRVTVVGRSGDGQRGAARVDLGNDPRWVVVMVQDGFR
ncbi:hypothetical protein [Microlunatus sp. Gsoil 973]|uniref:hypothetical protein n=1 Tax=Microlunatus sp. Gsoil 973 TaxID=2672569 RepID=UPI0012B4BED2|nr:hypothetical protein [Microlunatus sp. Gsoil 973]QGN33943.1 hypothetical protein GJV80_15225 [Microlunatus sp. Gsoil 973]